MATGNFSSQVAAVILAAGASSRMGASKPLLRFGNATFLERIVSACRQAGVQPCVVLGDDADSVLRQIRLEGVPVIVNPQPEKGPLSSLLLALDLLEESSALIAHPVDHPLVAPSTLAALAAEHRRVPGCILIPVHAGRKGHPTLFPSRFYPDLRASPLEEGARWTVRRNPASTLLVPVPDSGILANLNTPSDLALWRLSLGAF